MKQSRNIIGWILAGIIFLMLAVSATDKIIGSTNAMNLARSIGITTAFYRLLGVIEIMSALLFVFSRTGILGTLLLVAYFGGAIATRLQHQENILVPVMIATLVWITAVIRFPELSNRINIRTSR